MGSQEEKYLYILRRLTYIMVKICTVKIRYDYLESPT